MVRADGLGGPLQQAPGVVVVAQRSGELVDHPAPVGPLEQLGLGRAQLAHRLVQVARDALTEALGGLTTGTFPLHLPPQQAHLRNGVAELGFDQLRV